MLGVGSELINVTGVLLKIWNSYKWFGLVFSVGFLDPTRFLGVVCCDSSCWTSWRVLSLLLHYLLSELHSCWMAARFFFSATDFAAASVRARTQALRYSKFYFVIILVNGPASMKYFCLLFSKDFSHFLAPLVTLVRN